MVRDRYELNILIERDDAIRRQPLASPERQFSFGKQRAEQYGRTATLVGPLLHHQGGVMSVTLRVNFYNSATGDNTTIQGQGNAMTLVLNNSGDPAYIAPGNFGFIVYYSAFY